MTIMSAMHCITVYMLGTVFVEQYSRGAKNVRKELDIASHPEYYRHHDCYGVRFAPDHDDPAQILERATMVSIVTARIFSMWKRSSQIAYGLFLVHLKLFFSPGYLSGI